MKIYKIAEIEGELILPSGTVLYHGTGEEYDFMNPKTGLYDDVFWTTESRAIASTYIPVAGGTLLCSTRHLTQPSKDPSVINIQKALGIDYDTSTFEEKGTDITSYMLPPVFEQDERYWNNQDLKCEYVNQKMKEVFGYEPEDGGSAFGPCHNRWRIKQDLDEPKPSNYRLQGKMLKVTLKRDFKIWDKTAGGKIEGDLMEKDYHKLDLFQQMEKMGFDGIKINDFAQSNDMGNVGHTSVGLFKNSLSDVSIEIEAAQHEDLEDYFRGVKSW